MGFCAGGRRSALPLVLWVAAGLPLGGCSDPASQAAKRGDRLFGEGRLEAAIAEYRLAERQTGPTPATLVRLGRAYAAAGEVDESVRRFETLVERDSSYRYQAATELVLAARRARDAGATENMRRALQPLEEWDPGLIPADLRLALARLYGRDGDYERALPLYLAELADTDSVPPTIWYEIGRAYEELGGCSEAVDAFETYLGEAPRGAEQVPSARWHLGSCLFRKAEEDRADGRPRAALASLNRMVRLGVPQTLLDRAHYLRGEILLGLGDPDGALAAYREVLRLHPSRSGFLARRAEDRIREIRFGSGVP